MNLLQNRPYGLQFDEIASPGLIFHALQLVVQGELLIAVVVVEAPAELFESLLLLVVADCLSEVGIVE